ncbi:MAG: TIR domain-containing protein [Nitrosomonas oligotropha]|uniref:TIR domain-containing protein n=1 Tax=Nitrosomonas oligotropha TaxID=42354 RepID=A0A5C7VZ51_9PROT|nr:MAG: TIR domain-containing protein [Nitrosomonas oligotropha]
MTEKKKLEEVFKLSGVPEFTFVEPQEYARLFVALRSKGRGVVIEGPSGIGKTTCVLKVLNRLGAELGGNNNIQILSGRKRGDITSIEKMIDSENFGTIVIDDFHKLDENLKLKLSDLLKILADEENEGSKLVLVGINKTGHSLIQYSSDLRNRIDIIRFESNSEEKLQELLVKGEQNLKVDLNVKNEIIKDSQGSFHLAQMLAHHACLRSNILIECDVVTPTTISFETLREFILDDLSVSFSQITMKFCKGQRVKKGSRAPYLHVLYWLSESEDMSINIESALVEHQNHRNSVGQILTKGHLKEHFESDEKYSEVIFYNDETTELSIEDPKYFYYIKNLAWTKVAKKIGFHTVEFTSKYDYALSFSGAEREIANYLQTKLADNEISVFYDNNEQARIFANNVEDYLAPIYRSESRFIVPILSQNYPARIWCKFEAENFKERFGDNSVIPLWFSNCPPGMFDLTNGVGGYTFDPDKDQNSQLDEFAKFLIDKIHQIRIEESSQNS